MATVINLNSNAQKVAYDEFIESVVIPLATKRGKTVAQYLKDFVVEEFDLQLAEKILPNSNTISFKVRGEASNPLQNLVQETDVFLGHQMALYVTKVNEANNDYSRPFATFPDKSIFNGAKSDIAESTALEAIYGGRLNALRTNRQIITNYSLRNFLYVPDRQTSEGVYANANNSDVFVNLTKKNVFGGKDTLTISIDLGQVTAVKRELLVGNLGPNGAAVAGQQNYIILTLKGFIVRQASSDWQDMK
jgi:hypothetical protein